MMISDPAERQARALAKRSAVLNFLAEEVWSSAAVLGTIAGLHARQAVHRLLSSMEKEETIRRAASPVLAGQGTTLWGITPQGRALTLGVDPLGPVFEPSKLSLQTVPHSLALQAIRLQCESEGWTNWTRGERLGKNAPIRPDAIATTPQGHRVAVECERTIKTPKRYKSIILAHLRAIQAGKWIGVYYMASPSVAMGLERIFAAIQTLPGGEVFDEPKRRRFRVRSDIYYT
jgi:hypothetical protein